MKKNLVVQILVAFVLGLAVGIGLWLSKLDVSGYLAWVSPFGNVLVSMLKMIVVPVILLSLISGAASLPTGQFGRVGIKVIVWYFLTSVLAAVVGSFLATLFNPGGGASISAWNSLVTTGTAVKSIDTSTGSALADVFVGMFKNPFQALANGDFLAIIVFSIAFGLALKLVAEDPKKDEGLKHNIQSLLGLLDAAKEGIFKIVDWILAYSPIGVFALTSCNFASYGSALFGPYVSLTTGVITGIAFMVLVVYPVLIFLSVRRNPFRFLSAIKEAPLTAFVTRSSAATLPVSLRVSSDELGIDSRLSAFSLPLGATINMDGVCVHLPFFAILAANMFSVHLGFSGLAILVLTTVLASIGAGGVPGGSLMLLFIILQNMGLPSDQIAVIVGLALGINPILDMFETMNNVVGDLVCTYVVAVSSRMIGTELAAGQK
ncbi:MAG: dicarboxylate/amino acid:cation symporter [Spirochaetia bacterium]|jgi:Na+/H+-dicarboxylate symporter|nr:dicarboxylate/amino acid:cation symporter [Spirochaetia bacterium]